MLIIQRTYKSKENKAKDMSTWTLFNRNEFKIFGEDLVNSILENVQ